MSDAETPEDLAGRLASALTPLSEIAIVLELDHKRLEAEVKAGTSPLAKAILKGTMLTRTAFREVVIKQALNGSSPAQGLVAEMMKRI